MRGQDAAYLGRSTVTFADSHSDLFEASESTSRCRVVAIAGSVMGVAVLAVASWGIEHYHQPGSFRPLPFVLSNSMSAAAAQGHGWALKRSGTACSNAEDIRLGPLTQEKDAEACRERCFSMAGCTGFAFQPAAGDKTALCSGTYDHAPWFGACQTWKGECREADEPCYDLYENTENSEYAWTMQAPNMRCKNWKDLVLGDLMVTADAASCGAVCLHTSGCKGFSYKRGNNYVFWDIVQGACYVYGDGECEAYDDNDWDDYQTSQQVPKRASSLSITPQQGCDNWGSILLKSGEGMRDPEQCASKCEQNLGCVGFGFSKEDGKCYLWNAPCIAKFDPAWDDYVM